MALMALLVPSLWAGLFAGAMSIVFAAPRQAILPSLCGGFVARFTRDGLVAAGADVNLATLIAAALVIFVATALIRRSVSPPVVMASALVPLGAALPFFRAIVGFLSLPSMAPDKLAVFPQAMLSNLSMVFTTTVAIGVGVSMGISVVRIIRRETAE